MTPEQYLSNQCRLHAGKNNAMCFHINVGNFKLKDGSFFRTGVPNGWSDLITILPNGIIFFCETKIAPRRPTKEQIEFINLIRKQKIVAGVAYTLDEYIELFDMARSEAPLDLPP